MAAVKTLLAEPKVKAIVKGWYDGANAFSWAPVSNGMGVHGIPDRVGCVPVTITPDMVGARVGLFVAVESKGEHKRNHKDGGLSIHQRLRREEIEAAGGICVVAYNSEVCHELNQRILTIRGKNG